MGISGLTWAEINNWHSAVEANLEYWEKICIKLLSDCYAGEYNSATEPDRKAPYSAVVDAEDIDRTVIAKKVGDTLRMMMQDNNRKK